MGRQVHPSDLRAAIQRATIPEVLEELSGKYSAEFGEALTDVVGRRTMQGFDMLHSAHAELTEDRRTVKEQVAADRRAAIKLHKEINVLDVQSGDKRGREVDVDLGGDERMTGEEAHEGEDAEDEGYPQWQTAQGRRRKGRACVSIPEGSQEPMSSSSGLPSPFPVGPLATTPRTTPAVGTAARNRSPMRPSATGTPAVATASGTLQRSEAPQDGEMISTISLLSVARQAEPETPCLDSLPSTPRASEGELETPCPFPDLQLPEGVQPREKDSEDRPSGTAPTAAGTVAPAAAAAPPPGEGGTN